MVIKPREFTDISSVLDSYPPLLQRLYAARGIRSKEQLNKNIASLLSFDTLTDIDKACARLEVALRLRQRILIIGDFDADGATSTALAVTALRSMGAAHVEFLVPNRFKFGYGLTVGIVGVAKNWQPDLIVTVDNGIASIEGVEHANQAGIDVLITDHHLPAEVVPQAYAIVNPNQENDVFPSKSIAGVGVVFYLMLALRHRLIASGFFIEQGLEVTNMAQFLDLVALGTVADVVKLDQNNRILVNQGLLRIRNGKCRPGILALIEIANKDLARIRENDLGFAIGPRLNAAGRLDDMSIGIECLLADNMEKARNLAKELDRLNKERRLIEGEMKEQATTAINNLLKNMVSIDELPLALCLFDESWHQGVVGILAGRLKERYHRPVIVFAASENEVKGSARSVPGFNIRDALASVDKNNPGLINKFGGHAMAAGLSLPAGNLSMFHEAFVLETAKHISLEQCKGELVTDGALTLDELTLETAQLLMHAGPWGQQFPEPCFDNVFEILQQRLVGLSHLKLTLKHLEGGEHIEAIAFNVNLERWPNYRAKYIRAVYKLDINFYKGRESLQLFIEDLESA